MARIKRYGRERLLRILQQKCPEALTKIPPPEAFEFRHYRDGDHRLKVGNWPSWDDPRLVDVFIECTGVNKPRLGPKDPELTSMGSILRENSFFGKLDDGRYPDLDSGILVALVSFIFIYCGKRTEFADFSGNTGLSHLISALNKVSSCISDGEKMERVELGTYKRSKAAWNAKKASPGVSTEASGESTTNCKDGAGDGLSVPEQTVSKSASASKKRSLDDEQENTPAAKKNRF